MFVLKRNSLMLLALSFIIVGVSHAQIYIPNSPQCMDLIAGKHIDAGNVCVEVADGILMVTYTTTGGWELMGAHLWVGSDLANMPQAKKGNPKVGHFPYHADEEIKGKNIYCFTIPLTDLGGDNIYDTLCNKTYFAAAHASLRIEDGNGGYQTESGWASGNPIVTKGSWAMYFDFNFVCENLPVERVCKPAFAFGDTIPGGITIPNNGTYNWGWQIIISSGERESFVIYADDEQSECVGFLYLSYSGTFIVAEYYTIPGFTLSKVNLYAGPLPPTEPDVNQYWHYTKRNNKHSAKFSIETSENPLYIVAHAIVCEPLDN